MTVLSPDGKLMWNGESWVPALPDPVLRQNLNFPPLPQNPSNTLNPVLPPAPSIPESAQNQTFHPMPPNPARQHNQVSPDKPQINNEGKITPNFNSENYGSGISQMSNSVINDDDRSAISNHTLMENDLSELGSKSKKLEDWRFAVIAYDTEGGKAEVIDEIRSPNTDELLSLTNKWVRKVSNVKSRLLSEVKIFIIPSRELFGIELLAHHGIKYLEQIAGMTVDEFWNSKVVEHNMLAAMTLLPRLEIVWFPDPNECTFLLNAKLMHYVDYNDICSTQDTVTLDEILNITKWFIDGDVQSLSSCDWQQL